MDHRIVRRKQGLLSALRTRVAIAGWLLAAGVVAAGCGGSSSPLSEAPHRPAGFVAYHGSGFSLAVPAGFDAQAATVSGAPPGSTVTRLTRSGAPPQSTSSEILILRNPHLSMTLDQVVDTLEREDATNPEISHPLFGAVKTTVPGTREARIVSERYIAPVSSSDPNSVTFDRKWLMMVVRPGVLLDVIVITTPQHGAHINPDDVLNSFRLDQ